MPSESQYDYVEFDERTGASEFMNFPLYWIEIVKLLSPIAHPSISPIFFQILFFLFLEKAFNAVIKIAIHDFFFWQALCIFLLQ